MDITYFPLQKGNKQWLHYVWVAFAFLLKKLQNSVWKNLQRCKRLIKETFSYWNRWNTYFHSCTRRRVQVLYLNVIPRWRMFRKTLLLKSHCINNLLSHMSEVHAVIILKNSITGDLWWKLDGLILIFPRWSLIVMVGSCHWTSL